MKKWVCKVCGYVHEGDSPPEVCPVCGVGPEEFMLAPAEPEAAKKTAKRWKCTVCDYIHEGDEPPETCPVCGVGKEFFVLLAEAAGLLSAEAVAAADANTMNAALDSISYGLYVVSSTKDGKINGQTANSVLQLTANPPQIGVCINKRNLTHEYIMASGRMAISMIAAADSETPKKFGYRSGRDVDKFADVEYILGKNGCPILKNCVSYLEAEVIADKTVDVGTHTMFVAAVTAGLQAAEGEPLTYAHFRRTKATAK
jgi:flavin reductase (DIM6/NTAB) family NADH-FMN oxidoreductase RutF/rubredoxin